MTPENTNEDEENGTYATWLAQQNSDVRDAVLSDERKALENLRPLQEARKAEAFYKKEIETLRQPVDEWFRLHPDERELVDGETQYRAYLRSGGTQDVYDAPAAIKARSPGLYGRLEELGLFRLDGEAVKKAIADGLLMSQDIAPFKSVREKTRSLIVEAPK